MQQQHQRSQQEEGDGDNAHMSDASAPTVAATAGTAARASPRAARSSSPSSSSPHSSHSSPSSLAQSARMREAQSFFQRVVKQELQVLLARGVEREVAVRKLLHRIVASTQAPEAADVRRVMKQFQMNYDDAVRALIVKQEIGRLKRQGMDAFAAIEELTRKMQRVLTVENAGDSDALPRTTTPASRVVGEEGATNSRHPADRDTGHDGSASNPTVSEGIDSSSGWAGSPDADVDLEEEEKEEKHESQEDTAAQGEKGGAATTADGDDGDSAATAAAAVATTTNLSPLSLCQRIDNVSISSDLSSKFVGVPSTSPTAASAEQVDASIANGDASAAAAAVGTDTSDPPASNRADSGDAGLESPRSRSPTSSSSSPALVSRKRRAVPTGVDSKNGSHQQQQFHHHTGPSTFPLFASSKKQKLMEVGDSYLAVVSRKFAKAPSDSPVATSTSTLKSFEFPVSDDDELTTAAHIVRLTKRHKSHSTPTKVVAPAAPVAATDDIGEVGAGGDSDGEHEALASS